VKGTGAFALLLGSAVVVASAQTQPNMSGTWVVENVERSERTAARGSDDAAGGRGRGRGMPPGGGPPAGGAARGGGRGQPPGSTGGLPVLQQGQRVRITQTAERLIVTTPTADGEQMMAHALDGSEMTNMIGSSAVKSRTKWEGVALVTDTKHTVEARGESMTVTVREVRSIDQDGRMVVRTTVTSPRGNMTTTAMLVKAE
jgi:hypothetical protein